jgi:hypothetical protein
MILYEYQCPNCGAVKSASRKLEDRHNGPKHCSRPMDLLISPVGGVVKNPAVPRSKT